MSADIAVIGAGAWGTALALIARRAGARPVLWARNPELVEDVKRRRENAAYLPGVPLDSRVLVTADPTELAGVPVALMATPTQGLRAVAASLAPYLSPTTALIACCKGLEIGTDALPLEILSEAIPDRPLGVLTGPTFAAECARGAPAAALCAASDPGVAAATAQLLGGPSFRLYRSLDPIGAQIGGAVKNVIAIACGVAIGRGLGENARAALITRGLAETMRFAAAAGGKRDTLAGLAGLGDLTLTCCGLASRNYSLGLGLGRGEPLANLLAGRRSVAEGVYAAGPIRARAAALGVDMPIVAAVDAVLNGGATLDDAVDALLARPFGNEFQEAL